MSVALALYEPDIPQNTGAAMRLCACLGSGLHIVGPTAFPWKIQEFRRSGMDYIDKLTIHKHATWQGFRGLTAPARVILVETDAKTPYTQFNFMPNDILILGSESRGFPKNLYDHCDAQVYIPMVKDVRSMNVITAAAIVLSEAIRQTT